MLTSLNPIISMIQTTFLGCTPTTWQVTMETRRKLQKKIRKYIPLWTESRNFFLPFFHCAFPFTWKDYGCHPHDNFDLTFQRMLVSRYQLRVTFYGDFPECFCRSKQRCLQRRRMMGHPTSHLPSLVEWEPT